MTTSQLKLKTKLKLKRLRIALEKDAEWNFGYSSEYSWHIQDEEKKWLEIAKENFPDVYVEYIDSY